MSATKTIIVALPTLTAAVLLLYLLNIITKFYIIRFYIIKVDTMSANLSSQDFWKNPDVVTRYATGGNQVQQARFFQSAPWLAKYPINKGETIVDIGAGTGEITMLFATVNGAGQNYAVDYSDAMVSVAHRKIARAKISNLQVWTSDATQLKLPTEERTVNRMISFSAIHWFPNLQGFIEGVNKYLAPGGIFFFRYAGCKGDETLELAEKLSKDEKWQKKFERFICPMHAHSPETMQITIEKVGLVWEEAHIWKNTETFDNEDGYKTYVAGWLPHLYHLQGQDREDFLNTVVKTHCARPDRNKNGEITVLDTQVKITGSKPS